jgi:hypothetical protein
VVVRKLAHNLVGRVWIGSSIAIAAMGCSGSASVRGIVVEGASRGHSFACSRPQSELGKPLAGVRVLIYPAVNREDGQRECLDAMARGLTQPSGSTYVAVSNREGEFRAYSGRYANLVPKTPVLCTFHPDFEDYFYEFTAEDRIARNLGAINWMVIRLKRRQPPKQ